MTGVLQLWGTLLLALMATEGQELEGFDCRDPSEARFYRHEDCNLSNVNLRTEDFFLVQSNARRNLTGHRCELHVTTVVGYCGHYSANKGVPTFRIALTE